MLKAQDIIKFGVRTVQANTSIYQAIATMTAKHLSSLPVVDDNMKLVGVISEKDVLELLYDFKEGSVEEFMVESPVCFTLEDSVEDICQCFKNSSFRRVAILKDDKVVSVISRSDIIDVFKDEFKQNNLPNTMTDNGVSVFTAKDIMAYGLYMVRMETPIYEAVDIILKKGVTGLPVVDGQMNLKGVITEKDILNQLCNSGIEVDLVGDIMSDKVVTFGPKDNLYDICDCLINNHFRRVMISNQDKIVGIISRTDIISFILKNKTAILQNRMALTQNA